MLYDQRLRDWKTAAYYYRRASEAPNAPIYLERFPAHMYDKAHLNDPAQEYAEWVKAVAAVDAGAEEEAEARGGFDYAQHPAAGAETCCA